MTSTRTKSKKQKTKPKTKLSMKARMEARLGTDAERVEAGVNQKIDGMCGFNATMLPPDLTDLMWRLLKFTETAYSATVNQALLKRRDIERLRTISKRCGMAAKSPDLFAPAKRGPVIAPITQH